MSGGISGYGVSGSGGEVGGDRGGDKCLRSFYGSADVDEPDNWAEGASLWASMVQPGRSVCEAIPLVLEGPRVEEILD